MPERFVFFQHKNYIVCVMSTAKGYDSTQFNRHDETNVLVTVHQREAMHLADPRYRLYETLQHEESKVGLSNELSPV